MFISNVHIYRNQVRRRALESEKHITCAQCECRGTVAQQVDFKSPRDRLSEVVHFDVTWKQISVTGGREGGGGISHRLPVLSLTVTMEPPPIPMLWGLTTEVHRRAAMAPSTADPPCCRMLLKSQRKDGIYAKSDTPSQSPFPFSAARCMFGLPRTQNV